MANGFVVWFTGLSGAGKSTLATRLAEEVRARGLHVEVLDGDEMRTHLSKGLGFSKEDRDTNVRRIGYVAKLVSRSGACAIAAAISPYRAVRDEQRAQNRALRRGLLPVRPGDAHEPRPQGTLPSRAGRRRSAASPASTIRTRRPSTPRWSSTRRPSPRSSAFKGSSRGSRPCS